MSRYRDALAAKVLATIDQVRLTRESPHRAASRSVEGSDPVALFS